MRYKFIIISLILILFFPFVANATPTNIVISQIQIAGEITTDEFVELYNPTDFPVSLDGWKLVKKTKSGGSYNLVSKFEEGTSIGSHKFFLITHQTNYQGTVSADATYTGKTYSVAANSTVILFDENGMVVDKVGFGEAQDFEGAPTINPSAKQSLKRKGWETQNFIDSNNNQSDFFVSMSAPRNSSFEGVVPSLPETPSMVEISPSSENPSAVEPTPESIPASGPEVELEEFQTDDARVASLPRDSSVPRLEVGVTQNDNKKDAPQDDNDKVTSIAKAGEESIVKSSSAPPFIKGGEKSPSASLNKGGVRGISEIKKLANNTKVTVRGVVSVPPGVLGSQIFYLSGSGIQVYMYKKDFPDLKIGDVIEIDGELSEAYGEKRVKLASRDSIKFVSSGEAPVPHQSSIQEIGESLEGSLVTVSGEIIEIEKDNWHLIDNGKEIKVLIKSGTNIPYDLVEEGDKVEITGIVSQKNDEYRLLPRGIDDINILRKINSNIAADSKDLKNSAPREKQNRFGIKDYLFVGIPSLLLVGLLAVRRKIKNKNSKNFPS